MVASLNELHGPNLVNLLKNRQESRAGVALEIDLMGEFLKLGFNGFAARHGKKKAVYIASLAANMAIADYLVQTTQDLHERKDEQSKET